MSWLIMLILGVLLLVMGGASYAWGESFYWYQVGLGMILIVLGLMRRRGRE